ncbi:telomerase reverse transcriptase-like isoform X2 [Mizuhopecten yessoensis]|nr:telomerase reverse transcriptase-like isoform X2 [Mizuhopecten yessoensis]
METDSTQTLKSCIAKDLEDLKAKAKTYARDQGFPKDFPRRKKQNHQKNEAMDSTSDVKDREEKCLEENKIERGANATSQVFKQDDFDMKQEGYGNWDGDFDGKQVVDFDVNEEDDGNQEEDFNENKECDNERWLRPKVSKKDKRKRQRQQSREKKAYAWMQKIQSGEQEAGGSQGQIRNSFGGSKKERRKMQRFERRLAKSTGLAEDYATRWGISDSSYSQQDNEGQHDGEASSSRWKRQKQTATNEEYKTSSSLPTVQPSFEGRPRWRHPYTAEPSQQFASSRPQSHQFSSSRFQWRNPNASEPSQQFGSPRPQLGNPNASEPPQQFHSSGPQWRNPNASEPPQQFHSPRPQWRNPNASEPPQQFGSSKSQVSFEGVSHWRQPTTLESSQQRDHTRENKKMQRKMKLDRRRQRRNEIQDNPVSVSGTGDNVGEVEPVSGSESGPGDITTEGPSSFQYRCFPRKRMFCSRGLLEQIPKSYILNRLAQDENGAGELFQEIFKEVQVDQQTVLYRTKVLPTLEKMLKLHKSCSYLRQLNYSCSGRYQQCKMGIQGKGVIIAARERIRKQSYGKQGPIWMNQRKVGKRCSQKVSTKRILSQHLGINEIYMFLRRVFFHVIPNELLGKANKKMLHKCLKLFLKLGKYDKFSMAELNVEKMKVERVPWLADIVSRPEQIHLLSQVVYWIFKDYIMVLLKSFLYITETAHHRNQLLYFRKRDWLRLHMRGLNTLLNKKMMLPVPKTEALKQLAEGDTLGVSNLRFLPKMKSLRPIVNLGRRPPPGCKQTIPINKQLLNLLNILSYHKEKDPVLVGSAIFGLDKVYPLWKQFVSPYQQRGQERSDIKQLYFVKVDIATCFEDIDQEKLFSIIKNIIQKDDDYQIRKYVTMHVAGGQVKRTFKRKASSLLEFNPNFTNFVKERVEKDGFTNIMFVDQVVTQSESSVHLLQQLKSHLSNNLVKVGKRYYLQASGISQGSVLSTILCNMYYGHMEKELFPLLEGEELLMRIVDDSLFVTPHKNRAVDFLNLMFKGIPDYNLRVNTDKVLLNFPLSLDDRVTFPVTQTDWFPWCGMLFNTKTLQASMDFSRYAGICVADTMSFDLSRDPLMTLKHKLLNALKPKSHVIYMDTELNTTEIVVTNIFKIFVLNAMKFHSYQRRLPHKLHLTYQKKFFIELLIDLGSYFYHQTRTCLTKKGSLPGVFNIHKDVVLWLCFKGFSVVLQKNGNGWQYKDFRRALNQEHRIINSRLELQEKGLSDVLLKVCGEQVPDEFMDLIP